MNKVLRWDIFCAVVDNFGDVGVCWRLARQLAVDHDLQVRLWVDDLAPLVKLCPDADASRERQKINGVDVLLWAKAFPTVDVADVVIEAFGCELPARYVEAMAARSAPPVWINLEYLSAEAWVEGAHTLPSPHPRLPLTKYFYFPGFTSGTGGLLREADYRRKAASFDANAFRAAINLPQANGDELTVSLFGYENPALVSLLDAWSNGDRPITCLLPEGRLLPQVRHYFGGSKPFMRCGNLTVQNIPFLSQQNYDALLWLCDLNFVRGEDSFVRAQWANKPLVWQIYPQEDQAHRIKLESFLGRYLANLPATTTDTVTAFWSAWNGAGDAGLTWPAFADLLPAMLAHATTWSEQIAGHGDLTSNLRHFVLRKAKN